MPTYEYRCKACGEHLEVVQSFTDDALTDCTACGAAGELRKVFGNIGITFKGSGFYKTDSRGGSSSTTTTKKDEPAKSTSDTASSSTSGNGDSSAKPASTGDKPSKSSTSAA